MQELDEQLLRAIYAGGSGNGAPLTLVMIVLSAIGSGWAALGLFPLLAWTRTRAAAGALAIAIVAQSVLVWALKQLVRRTRPWAALELAPLVSGPTDFSFPSGHACGSFTVTAFAATLLLARRPAAASAGMAPMRASALAVLALALAAGVAFSRVYLGVHYPGDVLAGAALGTAIGVTAGRLYVRRVHARRPSRDQL